MPRLIEAIADIVQRTCPMIGDDGRRGVVSALTAHDWTIAIDDIDEQPKHDTGKLPIVGWDLDVYHPTGAAHVAWWLIFHRAPLSYEHFGFLGKLGWSAGAFDNTISVATRGRDLTPVAATFLRDYAILAGEFLRLATAPPSTPTTQA